MKIGIIGAMEEEVVFIRQQLQKKKSRTIANMEFQIGKINGLEMILLKSGVGKVNAALATTLMIQLYEPDYIINTGTAGSYNDQINICDIVISSKVWHSDVDLTVFGLEYGQILGMPKCYLPDEKLVKIAEKTAKKQSSVRVFKGLIATSDSFNYDPIRVELIKSKMKDIYASEMEAAGIAQVCYQFGTPFIIIRSISDIAGRGADLSFKKYMKKASKCAAEFVLHLVEELKEVG